jgi:hypothetical protein
MTGKNDIKEINSDLGCSDWWALIETIPAEEFIP